MNDRDYGVALTDADRAFRDEVREFLASSLTPDLLSRDGGETARLDRLRRWQGLLYDAGLAAISWPTEYGGRAATPTQQLIFNTEMAAARAPEPINRSAINQLGPTIIQWGTDEQRAYYLPRILSAEDVWCQGFSEPEAGSDLASLKTRAVIDGDELVITGQKIWTSKATYANRIYLLARTDPDAPKREGISYILADLNTPGIEVRPIRQITGASEFCEVFLDSVRVPLANVLGPLHGGWRVAKSTLGYERVGQSRTHRIERRLGILVKMAQEPNALTDSGFDDSYVADRIVRYAAQVEALRQIAAQATAAGVRGVAPGPEASVAKLLTSEVDQSMANFGVELAGAPGVLERGSPGAAKRGNVAASYLLMRAATFGAGTSEIQRNVIAERLLGLPRDN
ncbi:acyl-CoA dehydrogenase family protein [Mycolicibacterium thermoresistibile]|uniref:Acyl-CoA dehydrogenase n=2 Tax=Mycolicibacterium thermoresistibile TaxID=1797 RepID=G7CFV7_MYCT3|nr:acyl-CoA dehydrogenase family protein [Mycolicibacterium thermoresistibile]EHI13386.1 acyl-CoA dehydrogenase [Mycolicibacterium thermoresistibile ATCC 19527]MCV7189178.1 acyl-CoA dehydrogenase family protein [Mycolicibacterium thermoresistibile]GAT14632.1 acyl-CoA dehydrogenase [Mycolicibacterium thermoresistibile]SNW19859.1 acyl-CoA dehydrogenase [Mycolicibacterium thermoresistibile]